MSSNTVHIMITGKVQGVFFRAAAEKTAIRLGLKGWVKNTPDGNVEAMVTGEQKKLNSFVEWCGHGPERAEVEKVIVEMAPDQIFETFKVIR